MKTLLPLFLAASLLASCQTPPKTLGEQLDRDNPKVIAVLSELKESDAGKTVTAVKLSDGETTLKDSVFIGAGHHAGKKQHIYLFRTPAGIKAYVWVEAGGASLPIPPAKSGNFAENATVLSGDIYTYTEVHPGDGVVIISSVTPEWLAKQR